MQKVVPSYYNSFSCIKEKCKHNCCIDWEIDIDRETAQKYRNVSGKIGKRLKANIAWDFSPHFILGEKERCPFLNEKNLCDIIISLGEKSLCDICREHPRFHNELPGRIESGLGLCCEAAAELIIGQKEGAVLEFSGKKECEDEIIDLRDKIFEVLQKRELSFEKREQEVLSLLKIKKPELTSDFLFDFLFSLERLSEEWTEKLWLLKSRKKENVNAFSEYMKDRLFEYENLAVYFIYRHFANAPDFEEATARALFAIYGCEIIFLMGSAIYSETGAFTFEQQLELVRLFSSEIEYSDENLYAFFDMLKEREISGEF